MNKTKFDETYIFRINITSDYFDVSFSSKNPLFRVLLNIELGRSLRYNELFETVSKEVPILNGVMYWAIPTPAIYNNATSPKTTFTVL